MANLAETKEILKRYNQEHLLQKYNAYDDENKERLLSEINDIDFDLIKNAFNDVNKKTETQIKMEPIDVIVKDNLSNEEMNRFDKLGSDIIKQGRYAVVILGGGQGTRLGHDGPKGTFVVDINPPKSIFEIYTDVLKKVYDDYKIYIDLYIMTSKENNKDTINFFEQNNYFSYPKEKIKFFIQSEIEVVNEIGKILLDENGFINRASSGNGAVFSALKNNGIITEMKEKGIEWVYIGNVDNILLKTVDPIFLGATVENNLLAAGKSSLKTCPEERVGVYCKKNSKPAIAEYIEISKELVNAVNEKGELLYGDGNISSMVFHLNIIEKFADREPSYHIAHKKINYLDENNNYIIPEIENAYKFESFIFDPFDLLENMLIFRVKREEEFAPIKNKEGVDSPMTAKALYEGVMYGKKEKK